MVSEISPTGMPLLPGDLVLCRSSSWLGRSIRWAERRRGEAPTWANHSAVMVDSSCVAEALVNVKVNMLSEMEDEYMVWRYLPFTREQRLTVRDAALRSEGAIYGGLKLLAHLADGLINKINPVGEAVLFRRLCRVDQFPICSRLTGLAYAAAGYEWRVDPRWMDPDHQDDEVRNDPNWVLVTMKTNRGSCL